MINRHTIKDQPNRQNINQKQSHNCQVVMYLCAVKKTSSDVRLILDLTPKATEIEVSVAFLCLLA